MSISRKSVIWTSQLEIPEKQGYIILLKSWGVGRGYVNVRLPSVLDLKALLHVDRSAGTSLQPVLLNFSLVFNKFFSPVHMSWWSKTYGIHCTKNILLFKLVGERDASSYSLFLFSLYLFWWLGVGCFHGLNPIRGGLQTHSLLPMWLFYLLAYLKDGVVSFDCILRESSEQTLVEVCV